MISTRQATEEEKARYGTLSPTNRNADGVAGKKPLQFGGYKIHENVTKDFVLAEFAKGKTVLQIEIDQGMKANTLYRRLNDWGIRSPHSPNYKKSENEASSRQSVISPSKRPPVAYRRKMNKIDRITGEITVELLREIRNSPSLRSVNQGYTMIWENLIKARAAIRETNLVLARAEMLSVAAMAIRFVYELPFTENEVME